MGFQIMRALVVIGTSALGLFVEFVKKNKIKSFNGVKISFDIGLLKELF